MQSWARREGSTWSVSGVLVAREPGSPVTVETVRHWPCTGDEIEKSRPYPLARPRGQSRAYVGRDEREEKLNARG